jgi:ABC-type multidrug transport system ATPase subunit
MGPNGSGKTTLFKVLDGQLSPDSGSVTWNASTESAISATSPTRCVRHVPQEPLELAFPGMTLAEHMLFVELASRRPRFWTRGVTKARLEKYRAILEEYGVRNLAQSVTGPLRSQSVGWQQIFIVLLSALAKNLAEKVEPGTDLLLLDEPTSSLDEENAGLCLDLVRRLHREGRTIILATHDAEIALQLAERVCVIRKGRLAVDLTGDDLLRTTPSRLAAVVSGAGDC